MEQEARLRPEMGKSRIAMHTCMNEANGVTVCIASLPALCSKIWFVIIIKSWILSTTQKILINI